MTALFKNKTITGLFIQNSLTMLKLKAIKRVG